MKIKRIISLTVITIIAVIALATPAAASNSQFVGFIRSRLASSYGVPSSTILKLGKAICHSMDVGIPPLMVGEKLMDNGFSSREASTFVVGAGYFLCPWHKAEVMAVGA